MITASIIGGEELLVRLAGIGDTVRSTLARTVQEAAIKLQATIKEDKLSGQVLNVRTGRLRRSINQRVEASGSRVMGYVGTNVEYARFHEYGYRGTMTIRDFMRRSKSGKESLVRGHTRKVNLPARSFMRSALDEMRDEIASGIARAVQEAATK